MGKRSRRRTKEKGVTGSSAGVDKEKPQPPIRSIYGQVDSIGNTANQDPRPYEEWYGQVLKLTKVLSEKYRGKPALCVGYDDATERLILWPLETGNEILVEPGKCDVKHRYTIDDCRKEIRESQSEERRAAAKDDECSICLEHPRAPVELPCTHRFCASCIARLRGPREERFKLLCPNCRSEMPAMLEKLLETGDGIVRLMIDGLVCSNPGCADSHELNGCLMTDDAILHLKKRRNEAAKASDIIPYLTSLETYVQQYSQAATRGHPTASKVKAHRDLMRRMVCRVLPEVEKLRRQYEGCLQVRATCGGIDSQVEDLFLKIYNKPLLSPEEEKARLSHKSSQFEELEVTADEDYVAKFENSADGKFTHELSKLVLKNIDGSWYYIRSFGRNYNRVLLSFMNGVGQVSSDPTVCKMLTYEMAVDSWVMSRLDAMEELLKTGGAYGKYEAQEAFVLVQLLYNVIFPAIGEYQVPLDLLIRRFGQEYLHREIEGAIDPKAGKVLAETIGQALLKSDAKGEAEYTDEFDRPLLLLRPCATPRYGGMCPDWCQRKEFRPNEFIRCKCKRVVYCSQPCMLLHRDSHSKACAEALRVRECLQGGTGGK